MKSGQTKFAECRTESPCQWINLFKEAFEITGDEIEMLEGTMTKHELFGYWYDEDFDGEYIPSEFTMWSDNYVYFPVGYDDSYALGWVPRNPCEAKTTYMGAGCYTKS